MKTRQYLAFIISIFIVASCGTPKVMVDYKANAEQAELNGDYSSAVTAWKSYFNQKNLGGEEIEGSSFAKAAELAYKAEMYSDAIGWFEQAENNGYSDAEMQLMLSEIYKSRNNLSKELEALEHYLTNFDSNNFEVNKRLFSIYFDIDMYDKALSVWENIPVDSLKNEELVEKYFLINKKKENEEVTDSVSLVLLKLNPENVNALEWNAMKYYWLAENHYRREMKKYEQNKTGLQYVLLRKELKQVTADFQKALDYFEKLWELNPGKKYAPYMANIHTRFDEDEKSAYYRKYLDK